MGSVKQNYGATACSRLRAGSLHTIQIRGVSNLLTHQRAKKDRCVDAVAAEACARVPGLGQSGGGEGARGAHHQEPRLDHTAAAPRGV